MQPAQRCPECGAAWTTDVTCQDHFYQMVIWEWEIVRLEGPIPEVHFLMVLSYHLQHPSLYSPEALGWAKQRLVEFAENGVGPEDVRRQQGSGLNSSKRAYRIRGMAESHGTYDHPVLWTMTAADVIAGGLDDYCDNVRAWARSIYQALKVSGNL